VNNKLSSEEIFFLQVWRGQARPQLHAEEATAVNSAAISILSELAAGPKAESARVGLPGKRAKAELVSTHACRHRGQGAAMTTPDRRYSHRYGLKVPLVFCAVQSLLKNGHSAKSINISSRGVYFFTRHPVFVGLPVHVLLRMPKRIAGTPATARVFTGRISHVESYDDPKESSGVGVEFFYWESP
jgi:hypothetical protein